MDFVTDLHLHSKYSRAVSQQMVLPEMAKWAAKKGLDIITTGDWTHPLWFRNIKSELEEAGEGVYGLRIKDEARLHVPSQSDGGQGLRIKDVRFILTTEIASIYKEKEKLRRIHNLVFAPSLEIAEKINKELVKRGCNIHSDGRPIVGISSRNLLEMVLAIDEKCLLVPCHVWTPHFGIYGSASGYNSLNEAFGEMDKYIYGIETGLSSDPEMNWQIEELNKRSILSFSDAHSLPKMGREATVFTSKNSRLRQGPAPSGAGQDFRLRECFGGQVGRQAKFKISYGDIASAIKRDPKGRLRVSYTVEFYPEEGKYHFSGHRNCKVVFGPEEIHANGNVCPVCRREVTEGVLYRLNQLSSKSLLNRAEEKYNSAKLKWHTDKFKIHPPYVKLVPLNEIIAESIGSPVGSEKVKIKFDEMCSEFDSEFNCLLKTPIADLVKFAGEKTGEGIAKVRSGDIAIDPGYDGEYGRVKIWSEEIVNKAQVVSAEAQLGIKF